MADINRVYDEAVKNGLLDPTVSKDDFKNIMGNTQMRKAYFDYVQEHKRGFYGDDFNRFSEAVERMVSGAGSAPRPSVAPAMSAMPAMPAAGGNPRVADYPAPTNAAEYEANRINQQFGGENNLQLGGQVGTERAMEQYSAEGLETRREQILSEAERKKQQRIREQEQWEKEHPFLAALSGISHAGAMQTPSMKEKLEETPTKMFAGKQQEQLREIEDELGRRAGDLYIPQAKETIKQSEDFVAQVRANDKKLSAGQKVNLNRAEYLLTKANEIANAGGRFDDSKAMANWWEGLKNDLDRDVIAGVGLARDIEINSIVEKVNNGKELTDDESALLNAYFTLATATDARQFDLSTGYQIGQGTAQSLPFMIDMFVTRGAGAGGKYLLLKALKAAKFKDIARVERYLRMADTAGEAGKMSARDIARKASYEGIATPLQTVLMPSAWRQMQQEATQMRLERGENDLSLLDRTRIFTNATKETLTERVGGDMIDWGLGRVFGKMTQPWRLGGKGKYAVNKYIQSPIGETSEEYIGALIDLARSYNPLYDDESNEPLREEAKEMFSWEGLGKTFGTVLPMSLLGGAANMAELRYKTGRMEKAREDIIQRMQQAMGMSEEDARQIMAYTESAGTADEFADRLNIVGNRLMNAYEDMGADVETKDKKGNVSDVVGGLRDELNEYATQAAGVNKIVEQFSAEYDKLSDEEKQNAKQLLEQAQKENRDRNIRIAAKSISEGEVDALKNRSNNYLYNVSFADSSLQEGDDAYVVGGNVAVTYDDEGKVLFDKAASEDDVVEVRIVHADGTSEVKQVSVGELDLLQEPITAEEYLNERTSMLYGEMVAAAEAAEADITPPPTPSPQEGRGSFPAQPQQEVVSVVGYTTDNNGGRVAQLSAPININGTITTIVPESMLDEIMTGEGYTKTEDGAWERDVKQQPQPVEQVQEQTVEQEQEPQAEPIGHDERWGNVYQWVLGKAKEAVDFLRKNKSGYLKGVFRREEIGDIDLMWGNDKAGLQHIIQRHIVEQDDFNSVDEAVEAIDSTIKEGKIVFNNKNQCTIDNGMYRVAIAKDENGNWVITAYDNSRAKENKQRNRSTATPLVVPSTERASSSDMAFSYQESNVTISEGKGSENNPNTQANAQKNVPFAENLVAAPRDEHGRVDYGKIEDTEELARVITAQMKGGKDVAKRYMEAKKKLASETLKKTKHKKEDLDDPDAFLAVEQKISELKREENRWNAAITALNSIRTAEEQAAYEAEQARMQAEREARKQTETAAQGDGTMAARYAAAQKIDGNTGTITAANGQVLKGHYVLVSADGLTPSHDARNGFDMSEGYPTVDGKSINDRDYKNDHEEQAKVQQIAQQYNGNAIKNMPIVSDEGLVYNGNGRTMAGQLAAQQGTDGAYMQALTDNASQFGFTAEQVASVPNARVVFQTDERLPYNTTTLALFNATEQQTQSNTAKAAANTRKLTPESVGHIIDAISGFDNTDAFFSHKKSPFDLINTLIADGVLTDRDKASLIDGDRLSGAGKDMLMGVLFGTAFDEKTIRLLADNAQVQNSVMRALPQILENKGLGEYSLFDHINNAIAAIYDMRENGMSFFEFTRQTDIFGNTAGDRYTAFEMLLAEEMMKKDEDSKKGEKSGVAAFREVLTLYNERARQLAGGQADIFGEQTPSEDIENAIVEYYKNKRNGQEEQPGQSSTPKQPSDRQGGGETEPAVAGAQGGDGETVTDIAAGEIIKQIEEEAEEFEEIELTPENWFAQFGEDGIVETPIGMVKMGENQYLKLAQKGREGKLGMIKPTLERPGIIIEDNSKAKDGQDTERESSYVFVKAFVGKDGERMYYFTSITIRKDGKEVVISNQEKRKSVITNLLNKGNLVWKHADNVSSVSDVTSGLYSSQGVKTSDPTIEGTDAPHTNTLYSDGKGSEKSANYQTNSQKSAEKVENASENRGKSDGEEQKEVFGSVDELDNAVSNILATYPARNVHALVLRLLSQNGRLADDWMWEHNITTQSELGEWCKLAKGYEKARNAFHNKEDEEENWRKEYLEKHYPNYAKDGVETEDGKSEYKRLKEDREYQQVKNNFDEEIEKLSVLYDKSGYAFRDYEAELKYKHVTDFVDAIRKKYQPIARAIFGLKANEDVTQDVIDKATDEQRKEYDKIIRSYKKETKVFNRKKYLDLMQSERKNDGTTKKKSKRGVRKQRVSGVSRAATKTQVSAIVEQLQKAMPGTRVHTVKTTEQAMDYIAKRKQKAQEQEVERVNNQFNAELQQQIDGTLPKGHIYQLGMPSSILRSAGIPSLPIELAASRLLNKSNQENHPFNISEMNGLVNAIQKPIAVFHSATHVGDFVILTNIKHNGKNFVAAIKVNKEKGKVLVNDIRSIHPRTTTNVTTWINEGLMSYADKIGLSDWLDEKIKMRDYLNSSDPAEVRRSLISAAKVVKSFENPKLLDEKDKIAGVFAHFQRVFHGSGADFDVFDSSHIGEGEGNQSYGYGMYVTEVKEVARRYAGNYPQVDKERLEELYSKLYGIIQSIGGWRRFIDNYGENEDANRQISELEKERDRIEENILQLSPRIIYSVTIPDNTGSNYIPHNGVMKGTDIDKIVNALYEHMVSTDEEGLYDSKQAKQSLREELESTFDESAFGEDVYGNVSSYLGSDSAASKFLHSLGYVGIVYPTNSMAGGNTQGNNNYVIFDDSDLRIDGKERFELDEQGEVAGATLDDGTVLLVEDHMRIDTPFHEFAHKLYAYAKVSDSHLLDAINKYISQAPQAVKDYVAAHYPDTIGTDAYLDEVFAWALSNQSEESLRAFLSERGLGEQSTASDMAKAQSWYNRLWKALKQLWGKVKSAFAKDNGKHYADLSVFDAYQTMSVEEIGNRLYDTLMGGKELHGTTDTAEAQYDELDYDSDNLTDAQQLATDAVMQALDNAGIETEVVSEEEANAEVAKQQSDNSARLMLHIMEQGTNEQSSHPISGTKLQKNLQTTKENQEINEKFNKKLAEYTNENADNIRFDCGMPSVALLTAGIPNKRIILNGQTLRKKIKKHGFDVESIKDLPAHLQSPIAVFNGSHENSFAVLVEMTIDNKNVLVSIDIKNAEIDDFVLISSLYGKNKNSVIEWINVGKLLSVDKEKALRYIGTEAPIAPAGNNKGANLAAKVVKNFDIAKSFSENGKKNVAKHTFEPLLNHNGKVYGYAKGGKIYLTENGINPNTPIHEYAHLWAKAMRRNNPKGWQSVVERLKGTPMWDEVMNDPNYQALTDDNAIASEVLARYSGKRGAERMENAARQLIDHAETRGEVANAISLIQRVKKALQDFWKWIGTNLFDIKEFRSAEEIADRVLYDLMNGTDIRQREQRNSRAEFDIRPDETLGEYAHRVARAHEQKKLEDAFKKSAWAAALAPNDMKASQQKAKALSDYLTFTFGDEYPLQVIPTTDHLAERLQALGIDEAFAKGTEKTINTFIRAKGFMLNGTIFVLSNRVGSISQAENVFIHERQHVDNAEYDITEPLIEHISAEEAVDMLRMLKPIAYKAYADMYLGKGIVGHRMLLDELIAYAMSESMKFLPNNPVQYLQKKGITNQQLLNIVENDSRRNRLGQSDPGATSDNRRVRTQGERGGRASSDMRPAYTVGRNTTKGISDNLNGYIPLNISEAPTPAPYDTRGDYAARFKMWYDQQRTFDEERAYTKAQKEARTKTENALQYVADRYRPLQKFQEYILAQGGSIRPSEQDADGNLVRTSADAYQDTTLATGRAGYQMQRFASHQLQDMADAIADILNSHALDGIDIRWNNIDTLFADRKDRKNEKLLTPRELIGIYAQAKDCQEAIEQELPDRGAEGFEKNLQDQDSNPISHQEVIRMVENAVPAEKIKTLWDAIHAATQFSLDYQLDKGMIDQETHDRYTRRYYVPERGWRERDLDGRTDAYVEGRDVQLKGNPYNPALKKAHGRESIASDPFAYIQSIAETTIMSAERNSIKQKFLQLLLDNQEIGMQSGAWQIRRAYVVRTTDPAGVEQQVVTYEKPTREEDIITTIVPESMIEQRTRDERLQHRVTVMRDGQQYIIEMQDEALANDLNSNFQEAKWLSNSVANVARTGVRYMSAINTQYNPAFAIWNLYRDLQIGLINNLAKEDKAFTARFIKNIAAVQPVIMRYVASDRFKGEEDFGNDKELSKYLQEYFESGAQTGFSYMRDINTLGKEFDKLLQAQSMSKKAGKAALGALSIATELSELTVRFAEFATARQMGFTTEEAAAKAKEISVNFDRKGLLGGTFSGLYSFFNATIQGGWNILRGMNNKRARRAYLATAALYMAAGVLNTLLNPDDPDDEVFFSEYDRQTNFIFGKIKLPVTHFFRMFFAAGVNITLFAQNKKTGKKTAQDIVKFTLDEVVPASIVQVHNAWGYNPSTNEYELDWTQYIQQSAPSVISPIVDVALNRDFKGATVHREPFLSSEKGKVKNVAMEKRNTPSIYHDIAYGLHRLSGGNPDIKTRGYRTDGWIDINPNDLQHLVEGYFGGSGGFFGDLYSTAANAFRGEFDPSTVPVLNRAFRPYQQERSYTQQYWMLKNRVDAYDKWLDDTKKNDRQTYQAEKQSELYRTYINANRALQGMRKPSDELPYSEKETKDKTQQLMQLNVEWNKAQ